MIDGIKISFPLPANYNPQLSWQITTNENGEIIKRTAFDRGLTLTIRKEKYVILNGSLHRFHNDGRHNYNHFTFSDLQNTLTEINRVFKVPFNSKIHNLEFGLNIQLPFPVEKFLHTIILYRGKTFNIIRESHFDYFQNTRQRYILKIYDKSKEYRINDNILRIEMKVVKMQHLKSIGISHINDLSHKNKIRSLLESLLTEINRIICCEPNISKIKNRSHKNAILKFIAPVYWVELKQQGNRFKYDKELKKFKKLIAQYNLNEIQKKVVTEINTLSILLISVNSLTKNTPQSLTTPKLCPITKLNIEMQKETSRFLCVSGIRFYHKNEPKIYNELLSPRLSKKWINEPLVVQFREIAHSVRNEYFNGKNNNRRAILKMVNRPSLFDQTEYLNEKRLQLSGLQDIAV